MRATAIVLSLTFALTCAFGGGDPAKGGKKPAAIWKSERGQDGRTAVSDGVFSVIMPADAKVELEGEYASGSIKQEAGAKLKGYVSAQRKELPLDAKKYGDSRKWLKSYIDAELEKDRKAEYKGKKDFLEVKLIKTSDITLGENKGLKSITDHDSAMSGIVIAGGMHHVAENDYYVIGNHLYVLRASGSGAPRAAGLFGDHTGFHRSPLAQEFFKSAKVTKAAPNR